MRFTTTTLVVDGEDKCSDGDDNDQTNRRAWRLSPRIRRRSSVQEQKARRHSRPKPQPRSSSKSHEPHAQAHAQAVPSRREHSPRREKHIELRDPVQIQRSRHVVQQKRKQKIKTQSTSGSKAGSGSKKAPSRNGNHVVDDNSRRLEDVVVKSTDNNKNSNNIMNFDDKPLIRSFRTRKLPSLSSTNNFGVPDVNHSGKTRSKNNHAIEKDRVTENGYHHGHKATRRGDAILANYTNNDDIDVCQIISNEELIQNNNKIDDGGFRSSVEEGKDSHPTTALARSSTDNNRNKKKGIKQVEQNHLHSSMFCQSASPILCQPALPSSSTMWSYLINDPTQIDGDIGDNGSAKNKYRQEIAGIGHSYSVDDSSFESDDELSYDSDDFDNDDEDDYDDDDSFTITVGSSSVQSRLTVGSGKSSNFHAKNTSKSANLRQPRPRQVRTKGKSNIIIPNFESKHVSMRPKEDNQMVTTSLERNNDVPIPRSESTLKESIRMIIRKLPLQDLERSKKYHGSVGVDVTVATHLDRKSPILPKSRAIATPILAPPRRNAFEKVCSHNHYGGHHRQQNHQQRIQYDKYECGAAVKPSVVETCHTEQRSNESSIDDGFDARSPFGRREYRHQSAQDNEGRDKITIESEYGSTGSDLNNFQRRDNTPSHPSPSSAVPPPGFLSIRGELRKSLHPTIESWRADNEKQYSTSISIYRDRPDASSLPSNIVKGRDIKSRSRSRRSLNVPSKASRI